ncbi:MAG: proteasome subunit beta [Candidatus Diapherotrites archaeon]|nr:proteasome subunit beta [Candidatus Diapherotrites archaeon]
MENTLKTGTTTVGLVAQDAIVFAADKRASFGHLAYDEESKKIYKITDHIALTTAGSVGDILTILRFAKSQAKLFEIERETKMTPHALVNLLSNVLNANRYYPFGIQFIIGGVNKETELFELTPDGGVLKRDKFAISGSGTELVMSVLDQHYKEKMSESEAIELAVRAVSAAKKRDLFSGGKSVSVMVVDRKGVRELKQSEIDSIIEKNESA